MKIAELELKILSVLWKLEKPVTVQTVIDTWPDEPEPGYTTVLKKLQVMEQKAIVAHQKEGKAYLYYPLVKKESVSQKRFDEMLSRIYLDDKLQMVSSFIKQSEFSRQELNELKKMIDEMDETHG